MCSLDGCENKVHSKGLCQNHYRQARRRGGDLSLVIKPGPKPRPDSTDHRKLSEEEKARRAEERKIKKLTRDCCANDHLLTEGSFYVISTGQKICKVCQRKAQQKYKGREITPDTVPLALSNGAKTSCPRGHGYEEHGYIKSDGARGCRPCGIAARKRRVYGLEPEQFAQMLVDQNEKCKICKSSFKDARDTHIDHDHSNGAVRAILCNSCNLGLGMFKDNPTLLQKAADYLISYKVADLEL